MANELEKVNEPESSSEEKEESKPKIRFVTDEKQDSVDSALDEIETEEDDGDEEQVFSLTSQDDVQIALQQNGIDRLNDGLSSFFKQGTPTCAIFGAACGVGAAVLCVTIGFWPTLLVGGFAGIGAWVGGSGKNTFPDRLKHLIKK